MKRVLYSLFLLCVMIVRAYDRPIESYYIPEEKFIVVVIASYNNAKWYYSNLESVFNQNYTNYHVIYIDDCSTDGTADLVECYAQTKGVSNKMTLVRNTMRCYSLTNRYEAIIQCPDDAVIIILDGDDGLAHHYVFTHINEIYKDQNVWLTYGQFCEYPSKAIGFCREMPEWIVAQNAFREYNFTPSHLRTFYAGLFKKIKKEDMMLEDHFFIMTDDIAMMFPMIEMARLGHFRFLNDVLYVYNAANPLNDHKVSRELQLALDHIIRRRPKYEPIGSPFV